MDEPILNLDQERENRWRWRWRRQMAIAQGEYPPQLVLRGGRVLNVFTEELERLDVAIDAGLIVGLGIYPDGRETIDLDGAVVAPSFIDPHIHLESTLLWPPRFAELVVPHGTGAVITDPHEIANVAGLDGIAALRDATLGLPLDVRFTVPSCVPASAHESPGASIGVDGIVEMLGWPQTVALGELMSYPSLLAADPAIAEKLWASRDALRDGHAPGLTGPALQAYAGAGITSDHESTSLEEARQKLNAGMLVMMRQGSSEKNLLELLPLVNDLTSARITFASDDRDCHDLLARGHVDDILRTAIGGGLDPVRAIRMATVVPALHYRLAGLGAVAPGYRANLVVLEDLGTVKVSMTLHDGRIVARDGRMTTGITAPEPPPALSGTITLAPVHASHLAIPPEHRNRAIDLIPGQIVTRRIALDPPRDGAPSVSDDLLKLVCVERHQATGRASAAYVRGFGLQRGALASSIAHDAHNIVAVGVDDADLLAAIATVAEAGGGLAVVAGGQVLASLALPIAGLMSAGHPAGVAARYLAVETAAKDLGSRLHSPFGQLAFLALSVIPEIRLTDRGLVELPS